MREGAAQAAQAVKVPTSSLITTRPAPHRAFFPLAATPSLPPGVLFSPSGPWQSRFNTLLSRLHARHRRTGAALLWLRGPSPAHIETVFPPFPLPFFGPRLASLERWITKRLEPLTARRQFTTPVFLLAWLLGLAFLVRASFFTSTTNAGTPTWADSTTSFWVANDGCGVNGTYCTPFDNSSLIFRCPAGVLSTELLNSRTIGVEEVIYEPLVVGGFDAEKTYRADSWVCASAIQAGLFGDKRGGCGEVEMVGEFTAYEGGTRNGVKSVGFESTFPSSYRFVEGVSQGGCKDLRDDILAFDVVMTVIFSFFIRCVVVFFSPLPSLFSSCFLHVAGTDLLLTAQTGPSSVLLVPLLLRLLARRPRL